MSRDDAPTCPDNAVVGADRSSALLSELQQKAYDRTVPLNVTLELTLRCNIRCLHCYNFDRDLPKACAPGGEGAATGVSAASDRPELSQGEILALLGDLRDAGCLFLTLTGGEVLSYPGLWAVLDRARDLNLAVQLLTNGTMLRPGVAARLAGYRNLLGVSVSLYGATAAVHDGITQVVGSWRRTWDGAERLRGLGIAVRLKHIVMRQNAHEVEAMRAQAAERGYPYLVDLTITARHDGTAGSLVTRVDDDQLRALYAGPLRDFLPSRPRRVSEESFPCNCARGNCAISVRGDVYPCVSVPWAAGNVRERPFADIWRYAPVFQRIRGLRIADYEACAPCPDKPFCSRDRGAAYTASGSYTGTDPFVCRSAAVTRELVESSVESAGASAGGAPAVAVAELEARDRQLG
jgi:radical SAM protein with 4Fe4S-binding SPASM domain